MASTKKPTTTSSKKQPVKSAAPKKKPSASKKSRAAAVKPLRSFRLTKPEAPFFTFSITKQTVYWIVLSFIILAMGLWIFQLQTEVQYLYDQIDATNQDI